MSDDMILSVVLVVASFSSGYMLATIHAVKSITKRD